jgi:hypothetical protein
MRLDQKASDEEALNEKLKEKLEASKKVIHDKLSKVEANVGVVLEQLTQALKKDHKTGTDDGLLEIPYKPPTAAAPADGAPSLPSSRWNQHRKLSPPYERPGTMGLGFPKDLGGEGLFSLPMEGVLEGAIGDLTLDGAVEVPPSLKGLSKHQAAKKLYIQCIQCSGIEIGSEDLAHTELVLLDAPIDEPELVTSTFAISNRGQTIFFDSGKIEVSPALVEQASAGFAEVKGDTDNTAYFTKVRLQLRVGQQWHSTPVSLSIA